MSWWQRFQEWLPEDRDTVRARYVQNRQQRTSAKQTTMQDSSTTGRSKPSVTNSNSYPGVELSARKPNLTQQAAELGVTPLYLAVLQGHMEAAKQLLTAGRKALVNQQVNTAKVSMPLTIRAARLPRVPNTALEVAIAMKNADMVDLLMQHGAILKIPHQLSLEELRQRGSAVENSSDGQLEAAPPRNPSRSGNSASLAIRRRAQGQLEAFEGIGVFSDAFTHDSEVQETLTWRDYEAALLVHTDPNIVEKLLKRQGYQLNLSISSNPTELKQLFEKALLSGNQYVAQEMLLRGADLINAPTFRRDQWPLTAVVQACKVELMYKVLEWGGSLHSQAGSRALYEVPPGGTGRTRWYPLPAACMAVVQALASAHWPDVARENRLPARLADAARCVEGLLKHTAVAGPHTVEQLLQEPVLAQQPVEVQQRCGALLRMLLKQQTWNPLVHILYPKAFKDAVAAYMQQTRACEDRVQTGADGVESEHNTAIATASAAAAENIQQEDMVVIHFHSDGAALPGSTAASAAAVSCSSNGAGGGIAKAQAGQAGVDGSAVDDRRHASFTDDAVIVQPSQRSVSKTGSFLEAAGLSSFMRRGSRLPSLSASSVTTGSLAQLQQEPVDPIVLERLEIESMFMTATAAQLQHVQDLVYPISKWLELDRCSGVLTDKTGSDFVCK